MSMLCPGSQCILASWRTLWRSTFFWLHCSWDSIFSSSDSGRLKCPSCALALSVFWRRDEHCGGVRSSGCIAPCFVALEHFDQLRDCFRQVGSCKFWNYAAHIHQNRFQRIASLGHVLCLQQGWLTPQYWSFFGFYWVEHNPRGTSLLLSAWPELCVMLDEKYSGLGCDR